MEIKTGDLVRYKLGIYPEKYGLIFLVIEVNGNSCILEDVNSKNPTDRPRHHTSVDILHMYMEASELKKLVYKSVND